MGNDEKSVTLGEDDREIVRRALEESAQRDQFLLVNADLSPPRTKELVTHRARALQLIELFVLLLCACADETPPPYTLLFGDNVAATDRALWNEAVDRWNAVAGREVLRVGPPEGECGKVRVFRREDIESAEIWRGACNQRIEYRADHADRCVFMHELGHSLGLDDEPGATLMRDCNGAEQDLTASDGELLKGRWGWP